MKYCIQGPFAEIVTAVIKAWRFLEGVSSPLAEKKGEAEAGALYALRCEVFEKTFPKKVTHIYRGKRKRTVLPSWQTDRSWKLVKCK